MPEAFFVLGHPVAHSKSPAMHQAAYEALGLPWAYGFMDCATDAEAKAFLQGQRWRGLNITMPYKPAALAHATTASTAALLAQGANVLVRTAGGIFADNTDGRGCIAYLRRCGASFEDAIVAVCGTGPTSMAIMESAAQAGAREVFLLSRDEARARQSVAAYGERLEEAGRERPAARVVGASYDQAKAALERAAVIVDATPLGMAPGDPAPFDTSVLHSGQFVFDVVYGHGATALLSQAAAADCVAVNGEGMLVAQAVETVYDFVELLQVPVDPYRCDLFSIMAQAAGFHL